ncbi:MAG TPA: hypothetical protein VIF09_20080 [Polyangiaceae bacterium]|jgi:hypothetical protein
MGASASAPPDDEKKSPDQDGSEDELEMTSIMDAEQRRELQRAARKEAERQKEPERETARPPAEVSAALAEDMAIPKAAAVPAEAMEAAREAPARAEEAVATRRFPAVAPQRPMFDAMTVVAFVLLAAAIAFALR